MALELVTVRARTRGKTPTEFVYQGVGKLTERTVMSDKQEQAKHDDGTLLFEDKERTRPKMVAAPVRREDGSSVVIDDIDSDGITSDLEEVANLYQGIYPTASPEELQQFVINGALDHFNGLQRKAASPVVEIAPDELSEIVSQLQAAGILANDTDVATWRRTVTLGAKSTEMDKADYVKLTREWKKLKVHGKVA